MTNGEVLQKTFPNSELDTLSTKIVFTLEPRTLGQQVFVFDKDWWNAEYQEPTTNNEAKYCDRNICLKNEYNNIGCEDCEVTKSQEPTTKNDLGVDWESYKDADGNSLDYLILSVLQNNFDCGDAYGYTIADKIIGLLPSVTPQEPKPMVEIDLYSVIKQKYIEREVLDKIRAEIENLERFEIRGEKTPLVNGDKALDIIDKYKAESEET